MRQPTFSITTQSNVAIKAKERRWSKTHVSTVRGVLLLGNIIILYFQRADGHACIWVKERSINLSGPFVTVTLPLCLWNLFIESAGLHGLTINVHVERFPSAIFYDYSTRHQNVKLP